MPHINGKEVGKAALDGTAIGAFIGGGIIGIQGGTTGEIGQHIMLISVGMGALRIFPYSRRMYNFFVERSGLPENKI